MKIMQFIFFVALLFFIATSTSKTVYAFKTSTSSAPIKSGSAILALDTLSEEVDHRVEILEAFLKSYNSPLADEAQTFIEEADKYGLDWKLVVSISGVESYFGHLIPYKSYNGWGWGVYGKNVIYFNSWKDGIQTISRDLRVKYINKWGASDVFSIGRYYAADPRWANKVIFFMKKIDQFALNYKLQKLPITL